MLILVFTYTVLNGLVQMFMMGDHMRKVSLRSCQLTYRD